MLSGTTEVGLAWIVILVFLRLTTHPSAMHTSLGIQVALGFVDAWLRQPYIVLVAPGQNHWPILRNLIRSTGTAGNLTSDAHLAAVALEHGYEVYSADYYFKSFPGVTHVNPLVDPRSVS